MTKKIQRTLQFLALLLLVAFSLTSASARGPHTFPYLEIKPLYPLKFAKPFEMLIYSEFAGSATIDITLSDNMQLLRGGLHWQGTVTKDSLYYAKLLVEINKPGVYKASVVLNATNLPDNHLVKLFPIDYNLYFYASEDTILVFLTRALMEQAMRDSLVFPGVATRRYWSHQDTSLRARTIRAARAKKKEDDSLATIIRQQLSVSDSIFRSHFSEKYTPAQIAVIKQYNLLFSHPNLEAIERLGVLDAHDRYSQEELQGRIEMTKRHFTERYELDQKIIYAVQPDEQTRLLAERDSLLKKQANERKISNKQK